MKRIFLTLIVASLIGLDTSTVSHADTYAGNQQNNQQNSHSNNSRYYPFGNKNGWNTNSNNTNGNNTNSNNTNNKNQQTNQNTSNRTSGNNPRSSGFYPLGSDIRDARQHSSGYGNTVHGNN